MTKDPYKVLGISYPADEREMRAAYRSLAKKFHPDAGAGSSEERFREIQDAYDLLCDPDRKAAYDRSVRAKAQAGPTGPDTMRIDSRQEPRTADSHIDLRDIFMHPQPEPIRRHSGRHPAFSSSRFDSWTEIEELLCSLDRFFYRGW